MKRGEFRRIPQGVREVRLVGKIDNASYAMGGPSVANVEYKTITLLNQKFNYQVPLEMLEMKEGYEDYIVNSFIVMVQNHMRRIVDAGIDLFILRDTQAPDTEIIRDVKQYEYMYAIDIEDRYRAIFVYGTTDKSIDTAFAEAKQVINKKIDDMCTENKEIIRQSVRYGLC